MRFLAVVFVSVLFSLPCLGDPAPPSGPLDFYTITPCRAFDSREDRITFWMSRFPDHPDPLKNRMVVEERIESGSWEYQVDQNGEGLPHLMAWQIRIPIAEDLTVQGRYTFKYGEAVHTVPRKCTEIPSDAVSIAANLSIIGPKRGGILFVYPAFKDAPIVLPGETLGWTWYWFYRITGAQCQCGNNWIHEKGKWIVTSQMIMPLAKPRIADWWHEQLGWIDTKGFIEVRTDFIEIVHQQYGSWMYDLVVDVYGYWK